MDATRFEVLSFDCYGTLIDWETGILAALRAQLGDAAAAVPDDELLEAYADLEHEAEVPYQPYRAVLAQTLRGIGARLDVPVSDAQATAFAGSVVDWPAFPDSAEALARLQRRFRLAALTNCDDDLFAASERRLGVSFDVVVTAQQVGSYKPDPANFHALWERVGLPKDRILHVAQSLFHDHVPAKRLGMTTVWIDRREGRGGGASRDVEAVPDARYTTLRGFADDVAPA